MLRTEDYDMPGISVQQADTVEELGEKIGVDPQALAHTVADYNASINPSVTWDPTVKDGRTADTTPVKSTWATPLTHGSFYAYAVTCGITFTFGGLKSDTHGRVLDAEGQPIDGLYVCGEMLGGEHGLGTPLRQVSLAERFGVSRTPVREALSRLQQEGLLERGGRGLQVRRLDPEELMQVYDLRILLEGQAAFEAASARTEMDLVRLDGLLNRDRALPKPDNATRLTTNVEFHEALWSAARNPVLRDLLDRLATHQIHAPVSTLTRPGRWKQALDEHAHIVECLRARDGGAARQAMRAHMATARTLRQAMSQEAAGH